MSFYLHDIYTLLLVFSSLIFSFLLFRDRKRISLLLEYPFNQKYSIIYHRKDSIRFRFFISITVLIIFSIILSFYLFHINQKFSTINFLQVSSSLLSFYFFKSLLIYFSGLMFGMENCSRKYYYGYTSSIFFIALFSFPIILFGSYFKNGYFITTKPMELFYLFSGIYLLLKTLLLSRLNLLKIRLLLYNILYLCALETLPYLALFRLLQVIN